MFCTYVQSNFMCNLGPTGNSILYLSMALSPPFQLLFTGGYTGDGAHGAGGVHLAKAASRTDGDL